MQRLWWKWRTCSEVAMVKKLTAKKVQVEFNKAIVRRDLTCMVRDANPCSGQLQCSHFYPVGGNSGLRFYPYNAWCQCAGHHFSHHGRNQRFYNKWMEQHCSEELEWMESVMGKPVRYTQIVLRDIMDACKRDDLDSVRDIVRGLFK